MYVMLFQGLYLLDRLALEASAALRWAPMTLLFVLASSWWVKGPVFVAAAAVGDFRAHHRFPIGGVFATASAAAAAALAALVKEVVDRSRPEHAGVDVDPLVSTPDSPSFPSGHAATAFAAATVVALVHPRLRLPVLALAALVALSRVYLGVHYGVDVLAGAALGIGVALAVSRASRRVAPAPVRTAA